MSAQKERRRLSFPAAELPPGSGKVVLAGRREIFVVNNGESLYAVFNRCPHERAPLDRGFLGGTNLPTQTVGEYVFGLDQRVLRCPWHGYEFDLENGHCLADPERFRIATYEVVREGEEIAVYV